MTAPLAKEQLQLLSSTNLTYADAPVQPSRHTGLFAAIAAGARWVAAWPRRQAVLDELSRLTDRELADIGLNRSELRSVFTRAR